MKGRRDDKIENMGWKKAIFLQWISKAGTEIYYGKKPYRIVVSSTKYHELLKHFSKNSVNIGTSKTDPPRGSVGEWLQKDVTKTAIASYVGPILIHEGYVEKVDRSEIRFN